MRALVASGGTDGNVDLVATYAYPTEQQRHKQSWVRANMVSSLDGSAVRNGRSEGLSSEPDKAVFSLLRGLADVVLVGAGTARTEGYRALRPDPTYADLRLRLGQRPAPVLALVSGRLDLDPASELFGTPPTIVITHAGTTATDRDRLAEVADVVVAGAEKVDLADALHQLADRGLTRVLCEGGPSLLSALVAAERLDELCLTFDPRLVGGDGSRVTAGPDLDASLRLGSALEQDGVLLSRWLVD